LKINLSIILTHLPECRLPFARFGSPDFNGLVLAPALRELLVLDIAWRAQSEYVWMSHYEIARSAGVTDAQIASIQQGQIRSIAFTAKEKQLLRLLHCAAECQVVSLPDFEEARKHFSDQELVEIMILQSHYEHVASVPNVLMSPD
jgi:alkylhydroperoxidase family enzyme